jgi:uncharacterized protein (TIGR02611 family)
VQPRPGDGARPDARVHRHIGPASRYRAFRRGLQANPLVDFTWRVGVLTVGGVVLAAGIAMLALPGPGWATIFVGMMILASEFAWARRSLDWARDRAKRTQARAMAPEVRRRNQALAVLVSALLVAGVVWYWQTYGFPGPVGDWAVQVWNT